jgi:hypothetical protein
MRRCLHQTFVILFAGFFLSSIHAQTVNLSGVVKDASTQQGISGATVKLVGLKDSTTTDAGGAYLLTGSAVRFFRSMGPQFLTTPHFTGTSIVFGIVDNAAQVRADIYDLSGRHVASLLDKKIERGTYRINPYLSTLSGQIYFAKIRTGSKTTMLKMPYTDKSSSGMGGLLRKITGGDIGNGLAKPAAVDDTIKVISAGYLTSSKAITAYTGANNFSLAWTGFGGSISFEMASYQACQNPALITVVDSSVTGPTLTIHVNSTTTPAGFSMTLKAVAGAVGTYADSVYFSVKKADSTKRILKVLDQDSVFASYNHITPSHPAALRTTGTYWSGTTGQFGPGASQYFGLKAKMLINLFDGDLNDSEVVVTVKSPKDTTGISLALKPVPANPGSYSGKVGFSTTTSVPGSIIAINGGDSLGQLITMIYHDIAPVGTLYGSICTWIPSAGTLVLDSTAYHGTTSKMGITLIDDDILDSSVVVNIKSKKDATGIRDTLKLDPDAPGNYIGQVGFSTTASAARVIAVADGDTVSVTYQDDTPIKTVSLKASWNSN